MLHDVKVMSMSPQKGKVRENKSWQANWWDFQPLAERSLRPLEWSQSSIIFCAHPTQPLITARHFSSSKQFVISSPAQVVTAPTSYGPPALISVAPDDNWLFAYFPGHNIQGIGCLWSRGPQIDNWSVKESWHITHGAGPVAASWLGQPREWVSGSTPGSATRLPPRGPRPAVSSPTLLLVTQDHSINLCYYRQYIPSLKFVTCSIAQAATSGEGPVSPADSAATFKQCFRAAIGLGYNEQSFLIATRSHYVPPPLDITSQYGTNLRQGSNTPLSAPELQALEWENWGEDPTINISEVQIIFNGYQFVLNVEPLPPLLGCGNTLVGLDFISVPPPLEVPNLPSSPRKSQERLLFYLVSSYLDFGNYESTPISELVAHSVTRFSNPPKSTWQIRKKATRSFAPSVVAFVSPPPIQLQLDKPLVLVGVIDTSGPLLPARSNLKKSSIGSTKVLNLSDLTDRMDYEDSPILSDVMRLAQDIPLNAVLSPNGALLCTIASSQSPVRTLVHSLPRLKNPSDVSGHQILPLASSLASAVVTGKCPVDVAHTLSLQTTLFEDAVETLLQTDSILDDQPSGFSHSFTIQMLGAVIATYKELALVIKSSNEDLNSRWKAAHDICSLLSCNDAFEDCNDGSIYDLDAVWQLTGLSAWVISFAERVLKECVISCDLRQDHFQGNLNETTISSFEPPLNAPVLLHIVHPFALDEFITALSHVQKFCAYIGSLTASGESAQIARDIILDLVGNSGIELPALINSLEHTRQDVLGLDRESCRRALISCRPTSDMHQSLSKTISNITQASVVTKPTLFIKPHDLVEGVGNLLPASKKGKYKDVISKNIISSMPASMMCLQCGENTTLVEAIAKEGTLSSRWRAWEKKWMRRCICGGRWKTNGISL